MREIEMKFRVNDLDDFIKLLTLKECVISDELKQFDTIYVMDLNDVKSKEGSVWLRVRKSNDVVELNYKKQSVNKMESKEIEFGVTSYDDANELLKALGYKEWVRVNKVRRFTKYKDVNICIDVVERLGSFVELELLIGEDNDVDYESILNNVAIELGIDINDRVDSHYDTMISEL